MMPILDTGKIMEDLKTEKQKTRILIRLVIALFFVCCILLFYATKPNAFGNCDCENQVQQERTKVKATFEYNIKNHKVMHIQGEDIVCVKNVVK